jgi:hypothetical protein
MIASRRLASSAILGGVFLVAFSAANACSKGQTPTCGDAGPEEECGPYTVLPDALPDSTESDAGNNGGDAEESDASEPDADAAAPQDAGDAAPTDASGAADGHADSASDHISDSGNDASG